MSGGAGGSANSSCLFPESGIDLASGSKLVSIRPAIDSRERLGAVVSNGRIFYTSQASGFVVSQTYGEESKVLPAVWEQN